MVCCFTSSEKLARATVSVPIINEAAVNFVQMTGEAVPDGQFGDAPEVFFFHDSARRIVRVAQNHHFRPGGNLLGQLFGTEAKVIFHLPLD